MLTRIKYFAYLFVILASANVSAAILDKDEAAQADLSMLQDETQIFQSIGMGIALSIAQCEGIDICSLTVEKDEIQELINTLDTRIDSLVLRQEEAEDPVSFDKVLTAYITERENYSTHLEKLKNITSTLDAESDLLDKSLELDEEESDFPVETAKDEELLDYVNELEAFEDDELEDDEELEDLPDFDEPDTTP
jgi:hypothetical protein